MNEQPAALLAEALAACELERAEVERGKDGRARLSQRQAIALADEVRRLKHHNAVLHGEVSRFTSNA